MVRVAYFDNYVDEDFFKKITGINVIKSSICYSNEIRLRKIRASTFTFHNKDWIMKGIEPSFGIIYDLDIKDMEVFKMYHGLNYKLSEIKVSEIDVKSVDDFMFNKYRIIEHDVPCLCFVAEKTADNRKAYINRKNKIRFNKKLLLSLLKI